MTALRPHEDEAIARRMFERGVGAPWRVERFGASQNAVFRAVSANGEVFAVKQYRNPDSAARERAVYDRLAPLGATAEIVWTGAVDGVEGLITRYVDGPSLLSAVDQGVDVSREAARVASYVQRCVEVPTRGFGPIGAGLVGPSTTWRGCLSDHVSRIASQRDRWPSGPVRDGLERAADALLEAFEAERSYLDAVRPVLVPIDLNLSNFVLDAKTDRLVALDLEGFWSADALLAVGEWTGHAFGTRHHEAFCRAWGPLDDARWRAVRLYALLSNFDVLHYVVTAASGSGEDARPWGSPFSFLDLMAWHREALTAGRSGRRPAERLLTSSTATITWGMKRADTGARCTSFAEALPAFEAAAQIAGVSRVAEITELDVTGLCVHQAVRPDAADGPHTFTVFSGKGLTREQSRLGALAEAVERFCAERGAYSGEVITGRASDLAAAHPLVPPDAFNAPPRDGAEHDEEWVWAMDLETRAPALVPACAVFYPYTSSPAGQRSPLRGFTTGLGAGCTRVEAIAHGLREVIERDAAALNRIVRDRPVVDLATIDDPESLRALERLRRTDADVIVRHISPDDVDVPVFSVICDDRTARDNLFVSGGYGAHPCAAVALRHALYEAALSRVGTISGAREDLQKFRAARSGMSYDEFRRRYRYWFDTSGPKVSFGSIPSRALPSVLEDLSSMTDAIARLGVHRPLVVDLTPPAFDGVYVVKVLVPGIERYSFDMACVGSRAKAMYRARYGRDLSAA